MKQNSETTILFMKRPPNALFILVILTWISLTLFYVSYLGFSHSAPFFPFLSTILGLFFLSFGVMIFSTSTILSEKKIIRQNLITTYKNEVLLSNIRSFSITQNPKLPLSYLCIVDNKDQKHWFYYSKELFDSVFLSEMKKRNIRSQ